MNAPISIVAERETLLAERRRATLVLIGLFWLFAFVVLSLRAAFVDTIPFEVMAPRRFVYACFGTLMCVGMVYALDRLHGSTFSRRVLWGVAGAILMAVVQSLFNNVIVRELFPIPGIAPMSVSIFVQWMVVWLGYFLAWTGTHLALTYHWDAQDQQMRTAAMRELAQEARIAALRYQVNPHFLFNALNSISSLVLERRNEEAEVMLLNLAAFLHSTLAADREGTIGLDEEIALQRRYLDIEAARFSERMKVTIEVPEALAHARVPTLILQPLIENAVRHGVDRSEQITTIRIVAAADRGQLRLVVEDDGEGDGPSRRGTGLGLANVGERLQAHFGDHGRLTAGPLSPSGYRAAIELPLELAA
ncbi:histidine kinase [Sphingosinicella sp. LHD-64]|uniref:sensor histidine kinase n=1 Tax=Sphingosinicella sp. LHD-64 TaxID=3072139 RepID=UPI0028104328|nr:histidine kinase [Sphingosinicella sp. LHD-64]MDQ8755777.1 histidine kinase [Sphingosinicella sp. LHD-64]